MTDLLTTYRPTKVLLQLDPNLAEGTYSGRVKIDYEFTGETPESKIQASRDFQWTSVRLATFYEFNEGYPVYASVDSEDYVHDTETEILTIPLGTPLTPETTQNGFYINLEWTGPINAPGSTDGLYAVDETTLEANMRDGNAHKVFPCYEGGVSAKFWFTVITDERTRVETNLDDAGHEDFEGRVKNNFYTDEQLTIEDVSIRITPIIDME
ncbi:CBN-PEPM-1 protein [Caenorhabditis brenneri]|uniref:CBN-PEPM-1 protein n=1 Tax=Caenorhabditis brenneri TaxID=135651 RepID=G0NMA8_CAEBE|nr:CBN-PEPM-1 protein [Caenorhabditis brenneri]